MPILCIIGPLFIKQADDLFDKEVKNQRLKSKIMESPPVMAV